MRFKHTQSQAQIVGDYAVVEIGTVLVHLFFGARNDEQTHATVHFVNDRLDAIDA
jgi:hypothetical protein